MLQARVLTLGIFTDQDHVNVRKTSLDTGDALDQSERRKDIKLLSESDVKRWVASADKRSIENSLETDLVALQRQNGLLVKLRVLSSLALNETSDIDLLPVDRNVFMLENGLNLLSGLGTNTVACC
jgi:hypothetical protein